MGADMFDEDEVHYIGHSLGAIVGTPFLALQPNITTATLGMPGSSIPYLRNASTVFGPVVQGGLSGAGLTPGTPQYAQFLAAAQTILDSADPINYAGTIAALPTPLPHQLHYQNTWLCKCALVVARNCHLAGKMVEGNSMRPT